MSQGQRRLAAIMFTDMVGYTALGQKDESLSVELVKRQRDIIRPILTKHDGREVKTMGDAFLVEFPSALAAVRCAYDIQTATREFNLPRREDERLHLRVGVHLGDVIHSENDVYGDAVNVASRVEPLAEPDGVSVTEQVYDQIKNKIGLSFKSLGSKDLKNIGEKVEVFKLILPWETNTGTTSSLDTHRIAVLPFVNMSPDPQDEFFADGLTEELIDRLCQVRGLEVIARTSIMSYKKKDVKAADIGRDLRAGALVEGSVRKAGNKIRVTAQLVNANTEAHLWSSKYDRDIKDIFALQTDIADQVANALEIRLLPGEKNAIQKMPTKSTEAYSLYLKGRQFWNRRTKDSVKEAIECFKGASIIDPSFALAYAGLADCYYVQIIGAFESGPEVAANAKRSVLRALKLDPSLAEAHTTYAMMLGTFEWKWEEAELEFKRAIELNPNYATAHHWYSCTVLRYAGRVEEEMREAERAIELDPLAPMITANKGQSLFMQERYDEALECFKRAQAIDPGFDEGILGQAQIYIAKRQYSEASALYQIYNQRAGVSENQLKLQRVWVLGSTRQEEEARRLLADVEASSDKSIPPREYAIAYYGIGDLGKTFEYLEEAVNQKDPLVPLYLMHPLGKALRSDPRYFELKRKVGI